MWFNVSPQSGLSFTNDVSHSFTLPFSEQSRVRLMTAFSAVDISESFLCFVFELNISESLLVFNGLTHADTCEEIHSELKAGFDPALTELHNITAGGRCTAAHPQLCDPGSQQRAV